MDNSWASAPAGSGKAQGLKPVFTDDAARLKPSPDTKLTDFLHSPETHLQAIDSISRYSPEFLALWTWRRLVWASMSHTHLPIGALTPSETQAPEREFAQAVGPQPSALGIFGLRLCATK